MKRRTASLTRRSARAGQDEKEFGRNDECITIERLERGLALTAHLIALDGPVLAPIFEKLERELEVRRGNQDTVGRAKKLLETYYMVDGGVKAIA